MNDGAVKEAKNDNIAGAGHLNDAPSGRCRLATREVVEDVCEGDLFRFEQSELGIKITGRYRVGKLLYDLYLDACKSFMAIEVEELKKGK